MNVGSAHCQWDNGWSTNKISFSKHVNSSLPFCKSIHNSVWNKGVHWNTGNLCVNKVLSVRCWEGSNWRVQLLIDGRSSMSPMRGSLNHSIQAVEGRVWLFGQSGSATPVWSFHSSWCQQTSLYLHAFWTCMCCNGSPPVAPRRGIPRLVIEMHITAHRCPSPSTGLSPGSLCTPRPRFPRKTAAGCMGHSGLLSHPPCHLGVFAGSALRCCSTGA